MSNPKILGDVAHKIYERDPMRIKDMNHFRMQLRYCGKELYMQFRDQLITYDQFIARVEEKRFGTKYQVLDDLRGKIDEKFIKLEKDDLII